MIKPKGNNSTTQYNYNGFQISYKIDPPNSEIALYRANGFLNCSLSNHNSGPCMQFHTEHKTLDGAECGIKKLLENYVDFEWKNFNEMAREKHDR